LNVNDASNFLKYDFAITQDLSKQFITVVSGVLVFSLTFSEKFVSFSRKLRILLGISWAAMLFAIIACGLGLVFICEAGGQALYRPANGYPEVAWTAYTWIKIAGASFIAGLISLIIVALARPFLKTP
jgi:hypothetical protein